MESASASGRHVCGSVQCDVCGSVQCEQAQLSRLKCMGASCAENGLHDGISSLIFALPVTLVDVRMPFCD